MSITFVFSFRHRTKDHIYFLDRRHTITDYNSHSTTRVALTNWGGGNIMLQL
jgi:hypothetical protein